MDPKENDEDTQKVDRVAQALLDSMPGLTHPEAWPWRLMARAAIKAIEGNDRRAQEP